MVVEAEEMEALEEQHLSLLLQALFLPFWYSLAEGNACCNQHQTCRGENDVQMQEAPPETQGRASDTEETLDCCGPALSSWVMQATGSCTMSTRWMVWA